jgi:uncharacterized protein (TIGR00661 family)
MNNRFTNQAILFIQTEGRGHITQALAVQETLNRQNIGVTAIVIRNTTKKENINLLKRHFFCPFIFIDSFEFFKDRKGKGVNLFKTGVDAFFKFPKIIWSAIKLRKSLKSISYDVIINLYEPLCTYYTLLSKERSKTIGISHQNIYLHPDFKFPKKNYFNASFLKIYTQFIALGCKHNIALSFYPLRNIRSKRLVVTGPMLRNRVKYLKPVKKDFILVYLAYDKLLDDIITWHNKNPQILIHCFTDKPGALKEEKLDDAFYLHSINEENFINLMSQCKGLVTTAGFESVCEALYLSKPVMMVPIKNHFEQYCNSIDALKAEAGIASNNYDISKFLNYLSQNEVDEKKNYFRTFTDQADLTLINIVKLILSTKGKIELNLEDSLREAHA